MGGRSGSISYITIKIWAKNPRLLTVFQMLVEQTKKIHSYFIGKTGVFCQVTQINTNHSANVAALQILTYSTLAFFFKETAIPWPCVTFTVVMTWDKEMLQQQPQPDTNSEQCGRTPRPTQSIAFSRMVLTSCGPCYRSLLTSWLLSRTTFRLERLGRCWHSACWRLGQIRSHFQRLTQSSDEVWTNVFSIPKAFQASRKLKNLNSNLHNPSI